MKPGVNFYLEDGAKVEVKGEVSCLCEEEGTCGAMIDL